VPGEHDDGRHVRVGDLHQILQGFVTRFVVAVDDLLENMVEILDT